MLAVLSAMLVMMESGSVPAPRLDLSVDRRMAQVDLLPAALPRPSAESPLRPAHALSDCNPGIVGIEPEWDHRAASQDLLVCRAVMMNNEPIGRAFLWLGSQTGLQADVSANRVFLNVRFAP